MRNLGAKHRDPTRSFSITLLVFQNTVGWYSVNGRDYYLLVSEKVTFELDLEQASEGAPCWIGLGRGSQKAHWAGGVLV